MRLAVAMVLAVVVSGCAATMIRGLDMELEPMAGGTFKFKAPFNSFDMPLDERGDAVRHQELDDWLAVNKLCPSGYVITDRQIAKANDFLGGHGKVIEFGRCK